MQGNFACLLTSHSTEPIIHFHMAAKEANAAPAHIESTTASNTMVAHPSSSSSDYRDHSHITDDDKDLNELLNKADSEGVKGTDQTFPVKLHQLLSGSDEDGFSHVVSWMPQ